MTVVEWLAELGGLATWGTLVRLTSRADVEAAIAGGDIVKVARDATRWPGSRRDSARRIG